MTRDQLIAWAKANGWWEDRYSHLQRTTCLPGGCPREVKTYRLKLSSIAARYEVRTSFGWVRIRSGYYKNLSISADGNLGGMTD